VITHNIDGSQSSRDAAAKGGISSERATHGSKQIDSGGEGLIAGVIVE